MGCATAYYLMQAEDRLKVAVVEMDPTYTRASTALSMSNIRIQFSLKENIQASQYAFQVLENFEDAMMVGDSRPHISFRREGNLFLVDPAGRKAAEIALALQRDLGCEVAWWSPDDIQARYPL